MPGSFVRSKLIGREVSLFSLRLISDSEMIKLLVVDEVDRVPFSAISTISTLVPGTGSATVAKTTSWNLLCVSNSFACDVDGMRGLSSRNAAEAKHILFS